MRTLLQEIVDALPTSNIQVESCSNLPPFTDGRASAWPGFNASASHGYTVLPKSRMAQLIRINSLLRCSAVFDAVRNTRTVSWLGNTPELWDARWMRFSTDPISDATP